MSLALSGAYLRRLAFDTVPIFYTERNASYDSINPALIQPFLSTDFGLPYIQDLCVTAIFVRHVSSTFLLDIALFLYHLTVFPFLGIKRVPRKQYIRIDRHRLSYLPWVLKLGCAYCGYANGLLHHAVRIAGDTELYFCPSKHLETPEFQAPPHHKHFADYGDAEGFSKRFHGQHDPD